MAVVRARFVRRFHRASAVVLGVFLALHLSNHVIGLAGQAEHISFMHGIRPLYRNRLIETVLLGLFGWQIISGLGLVIGGWRDRRGLAAWLQAGSGLYLATFVALHVLAVLSGRSTAGLDTDFRFAAAGFHVAGWPWYFWPYYSLAIAALFTHVGCALYWRIVGRNQRRAALVLVALVMAGAGSGVLIAASLAGMLYPVQIPPNYTATYSGR